MFDLELPDLDPMLLLSDTARREVEAMGGVRNTLSTKTASAATSPFQIEFARENENGFLDAEVAALVENPPLVKTAVSLREIWDSPERALERESRSQQPALPEVEPDLNRLFMTGEALEAERLIDFEVPQGHSSTPAPSRALGTEIIYPTPRSTRIAATPEPPHPGPTWMEMLEDD